MTLIFLLVFNLTHLGVDVLQNKAQRFLEGNYDRLLTLRVHQDHLSRVWESSVSIWYPHQSNTCKNSDIPTSLSATGSLVQAQGAADS